MIWAEVLAGFIVKIWFSFLFDFNEIWKFSGVHLFQLAFNFSEFFLSVSHCYL